MQLHKLLQIVYGGLYEMKTINRISILVLAAILLAVAVALLPAVLWNCDDSFSREYLDDLYVDIPDTESQLLIKEWRFLLGSGTEVYYIPSAGAKAQFLGKTTGGDDGYCPFHDGKYSISYSEGVVTLSWAFQGREYNRSESFTLPLKDTD